MSLSKFDKETFDKFTAKMYARLVENIHKSHWSGCEIGYLEGRLASSVSRLMQAVNNEDAGEIERKSADVANYAMMIDDHERLHKEN